jgi:uncharacterized membrane protein
VDKTNELTKQVKEAQEVIEKWWSDPLIIQLLLGAAVFIVIRLLVFLANRYIGRRIKDSQIRYRVHKVNAVIGYVVILIFLGIVFKDRLAKEVFEKATREIVGDYTEFAQKSWIGIVKRYYVETAMIEPMVTLVFNDNWIEFTIRYIVDYKVRRLVKHNLYWRILEEIDNSEGKIQIASTTLQLIDTQPIEVRVSDFRGPGKQNVSPNTGVGS